ncbi:MAG TPA: ABC transporter permease [Solirubrobacteraceae bacterium]|jgi:ribose/xylose/arabinose/galactoside ABC-type transport system permease subunit|nr:ABC transporter permease [Solirubrobacteraceae bacterium]
MPSRSLTSVVPALAGRAQNKGEQLRSPAGGRPSVSARARQSGMDVLAVFILVQIFCVIGGALFPSHFNYLSSANLSVMLQAIPELGIAALGVGVLMIAGEFDLSVGANYTLSAVMMASLFDNGMNVWLAMLIGVAVGTAVGLINALITFLLRIPSFITTLGTSLFWGAITLLYHGPGFIDFSPTGTFEHVFSGSIGWFEAEFIWFIVLGVLVGIFVHRHRTGNHLYAAGGDMSSALAIGINVRRTKAIAFALAGAGAAIAGILATGRVNSIVPGSATDLPLDAIAACVIGGLALNGGRGTVLGICVGSAMIYTIQDVLLLLQAPGYYLDGFVGLLIVVAAGLNQLSRGRLT